MLFTAALQLADPWKVIDVSFRDAAGGKRELRITVGYGPGSRFHCPEAKCREESCPVHDTAERAWRHWDFFQYKAYIHALVPRVACLAHGVRTVPVPWARPGSGFTLLFEAMVVELAKTQTVADVAAQVGEHDTRLWRFIRHYVDEARLYEDYTGVWIGNGVLDRSLEDQSLFGEFLRTPVSEGGTEPPVVGPPHAVVGAAPRLPDRGVAVPVHELLPQQPVRRFDHGVVIGLPLRGNDPLMPNTSSGSSIPVSSNSPPRSVRNVWTSASGKSSVANAASTRPASRAVRTVCACTRSSCPVRA